ncbi:MAG: DUF4097 domain-containing protein [Acidimicrobiia bacterium]
MSERTERLEVGERPRVELRFGSSDTWVRKGAEGQIDIVIRGKNVDAVIIEQFGDHVRLSQDRGRRARVRLELEVPQRTELQVATGSGNLTTDVPLRALDYRAGSGDIRASVIEGDCAIKTGSGDIYLGLVEGRARIVAASGDVQADQLDGDSSITTASGDIRIDRASGLTTLKAASGDVEVSEFLGADLTIGTVSGDTAIGLHAGKRVDLRLSSVSGRVAIPEATPAATEAKGDQRVSVRTVSGDIRIARLS